MDYLQDGLPKNHRRTLEGKTGGFLKNLPIGDTAEYIGSSSTSSSVRD